MFMKFLNISLAAAMFLLAASSLFAQNNLPDPDDSDCWQSLTALHQCAQLQQDRAASQAQRCTSYPEYQCEPEPEQPRQMAHVVRLQKQKAKDVKAAGARQTPGNSAGRDAVVLDLNPAN
jgi:hypothetical protein